MQHLSENLRTNQGERPSGHGTVALFTPISSADARLIEAIHCRVKELESSPVERIEIRVLNGEVYLRGDVVSAQEQRRLLQCVSQLPGVRETHHRLTLPFTARFKNLSVRLQLILALLTGAACGAALAGWCRNVFAVFPTERMRLAPV